jgi:hypothetical protein
LEDETGQSQYQGHREGAQSATYYLLMTQEKEFVAIPAGSWYAQPNICNKSYLYGHICFLAERSFFFFFPRFFEVPYLWESWYLNVNLNVNSCLFLAMVV